VIEYVVSEEVDLPSTTVEEDISGTASGTCSFSFCFSDLFMSQLPARSEGRMIGPQERPKKLVFRPVAPLIKLADLPYNDLPLAVMVLNLDTRTYSEKLPVRLKSPPTFCRLGAEKRDTCALLMLREPFTTWSKGIFRLEKSPKEVSKERDLMGVCLMGVYLTGVLLIGVHLRGVHLIGVHLTGVHLMGVCLMDVYLTGVHLIGVHLICVHLTGVHLTDMHLTGIYLIGVHPMGVYLIGMRFRGI
jgi:hypothetical protein